MSFILLTVKIITAVSESAYILVKFFFSYISSYTVIVGRKRYMIILLFSKQNNCILHLFYRIVLWARYACFQIKYLPFILFLMTVEMAILKARYTFITSCNHFYFIKGFLYNIFLEGDSSLTLDHYF